MHRTNPAKRALQTYTCCMKSTTVSLPPTFPVSLWCILLPQVDLSVNSVRKCRQNPLMSAWTAMEGEYHFDSTPIPRLALRCSCTRSLAADAPLATMQRNPRTSHIIFVNIAHSKVSWHPLAQNACLTQLSSSITQLQFLNSHLPTEFSRQSDSMTAPSNNSPSERQWTRSQQLNSCGLCS